MIKGAFERHSAVGVRMQRERARTVRSLERKSKTLTPSRWSRGGPAGR